MIAELEYSKSLQQKPADEHDLEPVQNSSTLGIAVVIIIIVACFLTSFYVLCEFSEYANKEHRTQQPRRMS